MGLCVPGMPCWQNTTSDCDCGNIHVTLPHECRKECIPISSDCVIYTGGDLINSGISTDDDLTTVIQKLDQMAIGGVQYFTDLLDVPNSYIGQSLKTVRVNAGETGLEFYTIPPVAPVVPGLPFQSIQFNNGGAFAGNGGLIYDVQYSNILTNTIAGPSSLINTYNVSSPGKLNNTYVFGEGHVVNANSTYITDSFAVGFGHYLGDGVNNYFGGSSSMLWGAFNNAYGIASTAGGYGAQAGGSGGGTGDFAIALNGAPTNGGVYRDNPGYRWVLADRGSVNISQNTGAQILGHGAIAPNSAIIGGQDHHVPADSTNSAIIGGYGIKARAASPNQTYVDNFNINSTPPNDDALVQILARDIATGQVKYRNASSLGGGGGGGVFLANIPVVLSGGKTLGRYVNGDIIPSIGLTAEQVLNLIATEYVFPVWNNFFIVGQPTTIEVELSVATPATFNWSITPNSGVVATIDINDVTGAVTLVAGTANDGSEPGVPLGAISLNANGAQRTYQGVAHDTGTTPSNINSPFFTITARYLRFWAPVAATPTTSAQVRALPSAFQTSGNSFTLVTGTVEKKFTVNLPPGVTIVSAIDTTNLNANITANFILGPPVNVNVAGGAGTATPYNQYEYNVAIPYSPSANIVITTN